MADSRPRLILPDRYVAESGLYLPAEVAAVTAVPVEVPPELRLQAPVIVVGQPPSFMDQVWVFATEEELGFVPLPLDSIVAVVQEIPFWPAMRILARFQRDLWPVRTEQDGQVELVRRFFGEDSEHTRRALAFLAGGGQRVLFSEQQLFAAQKLLLLYGKESELEQELSEEEYVGLMVVLRAILGSLLGPQAGEFQEGPGGQLEDDTWLRLFVGHGGLIGSGSIKFELARTHLLYVVEANSDTAKAHPDYCPLDEWVTEAFGLSFVELQASGFTLWAGSKMRELEASPVLVESGYFASTAIADRAQLALDAMSKPREWFREIFLRSVNDARRSAFEITPFQQRPALRFDDGRVMPFAPRALEGWLGGTGAYYRLFDLALSKGPQAREKFGRFNGYLIERHVLASAEAAHSSSAIGIWVPTAIGEQVQQVRGGESRTPDVALDYGQDLILIEVTSGRPTTKSIVDADPEAIRKDIRKLLEDKIGQLGARIAELREGVLSLPDVPMRDVQRIWPIVVNGESLLQTPALWDYLREGGALSALAQPGVQPLTLMDVEDVERLMGLAAEGHQLVSILESKTQARWREREFATWFQDEGRAYGSGESVFIDDALKAGFDAVAKVLFGHLSDDEFRARVEAAPRDAGADAVLRGR